MERREGHSVPPRGVERRDTSVRRGGLRLVPLAMVGILAVFGLLPGIFLQAPTARADSLGTLTIVVPNPNSSNVASGPVGANVTITGTGLTASDTYQIGYASTSSGCSSGFTAFGNISTVTDGSGNLATTFAWPSSLDTVGTGYYICAQDSATPPSQAQSSATFAISAAQAPAISLQPVAGTSPGPGTPSVPTNGFYPGSTIQISGTNFLPSSLQILVYLSDTPIQKASDLQSAAQLQPVNGQNVTANSDGTVSVTVQIPYSQKPGNYYLSLVSSDGQSGVLPSMVAGSGMALAAAPVPTATAMPTPTVTPATNIVPTPAPSSGPGAGKTIALAGLGVLSLALFILGVVLLASAASLPRQA